MSCRRDGALIEDFRASITWSAEWRQQNVGEDCDYNSFPTKEKKTAPREAMLDRLQGKRSSLRRERQTTPHGSTSHQGSPVEARAGVREAHAALAVAPSRGRSRQNIGGDEKRNKCSRKSTGRKGLNALPLRIVPKKTSFDRRTLAPPPQERALRFCQEKRPASMLGNTGVCGSEAFRLLLERGKPDWNHSRNPTFP